MRPNYSFLQEIGTAGASNTPRLSSGGKGSDDGCSDLWGLLCLDHGNLNVGQGDGVWGGTGRN